MTIQTLKKDINKIKELIREDNDKEIARMCKLFLPEYNAKLLSNLNGYERMRWLKANGY